MARIRTIKPEFPQSESMGRVSRESRLCFILLFTLADDAGRLRGNSRMLASLLYPYDDDAKKHIDTWLTELQKEECIVRYEIDGDSYIELCQWHKHQKIDRPSASKIPPPNEQSRILANSRESSCEDLRIKEGIKERKVDQSDSSETDGENCAELLQSSTLEPCIIKLPLVDKTEHPITDKQYKEWVDAYPAVNVLQQLKNMRQWCLANPSKKKTKKGINAFIVRWLSSAQDKGSTSTGQQTNQFTGGV